MKKAICKSLSWRITGTLLTMAATMTVTSDSGLAFKVGAADAILKTIAYVVHELYWEKAELKNDICG